MAEHTPGPCTVNAYENETFAEVLTADPTVSFGRHDDDEYGYMSLADARLIAAAPDLLSALKSLRKGDEQTGCWCEMAIGNPMYQQHSARCAGVRAAIAKAEGR